MLFLCPSFLEGSCSSAYGQGLEDALKARPPQLPHNSDYMRGYTSLTQTVPSSWAA